MTGSFRRARLTVLEGRATLRPMNYAVGVLVTAIAASVPVAHANEGLKPITIIAPGERTTNNKLVLAGLAGAGLVAGAVGFYFHLDSRSLADEVGTDVFTGTVWSRERQDVVDQADSSRTAAIAMYSVGAAFMIGAVVYWIATDPPDEKIIIQPRAAQPTVTPTPGGAVLGGMWSF